MCISDRNQQRALRPGDNFSRNKFGGFILQTEKWNTPLDGLTVGNYN